MPLSNAKDSKQTDNTEFLPQARLLSQKEPPQKTQVLLFPGPRYVAVAGLA